MQLCPSVRPFWALWIAALCFSPKHEHILTPFLLSSMTNRGSNLRRHDDLARMHQHRHGRRTHRSERLRCCIGFLSRKAKAGAGLGGDK
ncbi:hypothetical protein DFP72DRAFT_936172 [Ephemerocybe angulata]|uniref:Uncharacterized protein n=1 Tax=Ephemerocybe angulata TaxID=980116 RepID=A0A8H6LVQ1_9AGAR|nr:hypothetical protein DFP72DRAFT_936172 [Tulosesus angulatus]